MKDHGKLKGLEIYKFLKLETLTILRKALIYIR